MYILAGRFTIASARLLADRLTVLKNTTVRASKVPLQDSLAIRWGTSAFRNGEDCRYNSPSLIATAGNKGRFSDFLKEKKFPHVAINTGTPEHFPVAVRTILSGSKGEGIVVVQTLEQFQQYRVFPWSYWYNFSSEFGVHILGGVVKKIFRKVRTEGLEEETFPIRNTERGYKFTRVNLDNYPKLTDYFDEFYRIFPVQFGRADIGWDSEAKMWRIIEFNTAPDLGQNSNTLDLYSSFLAERI